MLALYQIYSNPYETTKSPNIRPDAQGYINTPGIFTQAQIQGWSKVTEAVHQAGGKIFLQLWHTGRVAHTYFFGGEHILAPSARALEGTVPRMRELTYQMPKPATAAETEQLVFDYARAAKNAIEAGFDGVEIHGANGYLIDQFLHHDANIREDEFGGSPENMAKFPLAVVDAIIAAIGHERTALRVSPAAYFNMKPDGRDKAVFEYFLPELEKRHLAYLHLGLFDDSAYFADLGGNATDFVRKNYSKTLVGVGGYNAKTGSKAIESNRFDLLAIGRPLIANPDYVIKVKQGLDVTPYSDEMLATLI